MSAMPGHEFSQHDFWRAGSEIDTSLENRPIPSAKTALFQAPERFTVENRILELWQTSKIPKLAPPPSLIALLRAQAATPLRAEP